MTRRVALLVALVLALAGAVEPAAPASARPARAPAKRSAKAPAKRRAAAPAKRRAKTRCHWVAATRHRKRHRVCVTVRAKAKRMPAASHEGAKSAASQAPAAPAAPAVPASVPSGESPVVVSAPPADLGPVAPPEPDPQPATPAPARLQVTSREFSLTLSRPAIASGLAVVELVNRGEDPHDLRVRPAAGGADLLRLDQALPGAITDGSTTLRPGAYTLYCSLPGHELAGMKAALTVG